jgi:hypothetical protein
MDLKLPNQEKDKLFHPMCFATYLLESEVELIETHVLLG